MNMLVEPYTDEPNDYGLIGYLCVCDIVACGNCGRKQKTHAKQIQYSVAIYKCPYCIWAASKAP